MRITFAVLNAVSASVLLLAVFALITPRFWVLDVPAALIALVELVSAAALLARSPWALRALSVAAWVTFALGLTLVSLVVITIAFLRGIHTEYSLAGLTLTALAVALLVPYTVLLPVVQLLWLKRQSVEPRS